METIQKGVSYLKYLFSTQDMVSLLRSYDTKKRVSLHILSMETGITINEIDDYTVDKVLSKHEGSSTLFHQVQLLEDMKTNIYIRQMMETDIHQTKLTREQESRFNAEWKTCYYLLQKEKVFVDPSLTKKEIIHLYRPLNNIF